MKIPWYGRFWKRFYLDIFQNKNTYLWHLFNNALSLEWNEFITKWKKKTSSFFIRFFQNFGLNRSHSSHYIHVFKFKIGLIVQKLLLDWKNGLSRSFSKVNFSSRSGTIFRMYNFYKFILVPKNYRFLRNWPI